MITLTIPEFKTGTIQLQHLLLDFNGTLAIDGKLIKGVKERLSALSETLTIHVITGNTFKTADTELKGIPCKTVSLASKNQAAEKAKYARKLGGHTIISIGNGRNDRLMIKSSVIGIIVIQKEGAATETLVNSDIICTNILDALDLIRNPLRLKASLRN
jgi:soluble P-type ATPase